MVKEHNTKPKVKKKTLSLKAKIGRSEQRDSNPRPTAPKAAALAKLRYAPNENDSERTIFAIFSTRDMSVRQQCPLYP